MKFKIDLALALVASLGFTAHAFRSIPEELFVHEMDMDRDLGESFEDGKFSNEVRYIADVAMTFIKFIRETRVQHPGTLTTRGAHAKALACLKGEFEIQNQALPRQLRVGLFERNQTFRTWIRISNSSQDPFSPDKKQNTRGFAMKLLGVEGENYLNSQSDSTLDLLTVASEIFVAKDNENYSSIADGTETPLGLIFRMGPFKTKSLLDAVSKAQKEPNPLRLTYFSTVPYRLGSAHGAKKAIKFRLVLSDTEAGRAYPAATEGIENLKHNILSTLQTVEEVSYDFQIQYAGTDDDVEDATTRWKAPYFTVAKVHVSREENPASAIEGRKDFCEHLSFNPWRTLTVHKPLGRINRARKVAYTMSSRFRHQANGVASQEPTPESFEKIP